MTASPRMSSTAGAVRAFTRFLAASAVLAAAAESASGQELEQEVEQEEGTQAVAGGETELGVRAGLGRSDNLNQAPDADAIAADYHLVGTDFGYSHARPRLQGQISGDLEYRGYSESFNIPGSGSGREDAEVFGSLWSSMRIQAVPQRFSWDTSYTYGQVKSNPFAVDGPGNRGGATILSTGPIFTVPLGARTNLHALGRLDWRTFEERPGLDSRNTVVNLGVSRYVSRTAQFAFDVASDKIEFDDDRAGYEFESAYLSYSKRLASGSIQARLGEGRVNIFDVSNSTTVANFAWDRSLGTRSNVSLSAAQQLTDAGEVFRVFGSGGGGLGGGLGAPGRTGDAAGAGAGRLREVVISDNPAERATVGAGFNVAGDRTTFAVSSRAWEDRFELDDTLDNEGLYADMRIRRTLGLEWSGEIHFARSQRDFSSAGEEDDDRLSRISLSRSLGRKAVLQLEARRDTRHSEGVKEYEENTYSVFLAYTIR